MDWFKFSFNEHTAPFYCQIDEGVDLYQASILVASLGVDVPIIFSENDSQGTVSVISQAEKDKSAEGHCVSKESITVKKNSVLKRTKQDFYQTLLIVSANDRSKLTTWWERAGVYFELAESIQTLAERHHGFNTNEWHMVSVERLLNQDEKIPLGHIFNWDFFRQDLKKRDLEFVAASTTKKCKMCDKESESGAVVTGNYGTKIIFVPEQKYYGGNKFFICRSCLSGSQNNQTPNPALSPTKVFLEKIKQLTNPDGSVRLPSGSAAEFLDVSKQALVEALGVLSEALGSSDGDVRTELERQLSSVTGQLKQISDNQANQQRELEQKLKVTSNDREIYKKAYESGKLQLDQVLKQKQQIETSLKIEQEKIRCVVCDAESPWNQPNQNGNNYVCHRCR